MKNFFGESEKRRGGKGYQYKVSKRYATVLSASAINTSECVDRSCLYAAFSGNRNMGIRGAWLNFTLSPPACGILYLFYFYFEKF